MKWPQFDMLRNYLMCRTILRIWHERRATTPFVTYYGCPVESCIELSCQVSAEFGLFFFYWNVLLISETRVDLFINYNSIEQLQLSDVNWWRENSFDILFFLPSTNICNVSCLYEWKMAQSHVLQIVVW